MSSETSEDILEEYIYSKLTNYETSHPNIIGVWREYLKVKKISYMKAIVDCDIMIRNISNHRDVSPETIAFLYALFQVNNDLNS